MDQHPIEIQPYGMIAKLPLLWPEYSHAMPNGFCLGGHGGGPERCNRDGSRWVAAEPSRYGFCVWGYDNDTPEVVRLGVNLSGREVERLAREHELDDLECLAQLRRPRRGAPHENAWGHAAPAQERRIGRELRWHRRDRGQTASLHPAHHTRSFQHGMCHGACAPLDRGKFSGIDAFHFGAARSSRRGFAGGCPPTSTVRAQRQRGRLRDLTRGGLGGVSWARSRAAPRHPPPRNGR